jgi:hypothetical protein
MWKMEKKESNERDRGAYMEEGNLVLETEEREERQCESTLL